MLRKDKDYVTNRNLDYKNYGYPVFYYNCINIKIVKMREI